MPEDFPSLEGIVNSSLGGCRDASDVAHAIYSFMDPLVADSEDEKDIRQLGVKKIADLQSITLEQAEKLLDRELDKLTK